MNSVNGMSARFLGVRGSIAVSGPDYGGVGGNTSCVELRCGGHRLILDGGTGLRALGAEQPGPMQATILFSHVHWDHIQGVPFFGPAFHPESQLTLGGVRRASGGIREAIARQMKPPAWPVGPELLRGVKAWADHEPGEPFEVGPFRVKAVDLDHPDGVVAWRVEAGGRAVVYATDVEHGGTVDPRLVHLARGADLLIHDAQYTRAEYLGEDGGPGRRGWGHSTWSEAVEVGLRAGVDRVALFHHDPGRDDAGVAALEQTASSLYSGVFAAREGQELPL